MILLLAAARAGWGSHSYYQRRKGRQVQPGSTLLSTLASEKIFIPSACGGGGMCTVFVSGNSGGGEILPTETGHISMRQLKTIGVFAR